MKKDHILALDQGTTGSRAFIFDGRGQIVASHYKEFKQYFPQPGWVEHDAEEIWASCCDVIKGALRKGRVSPKRIAAVGITNQRETTVLWDAKTSKPVARAIVWQCRRTSDICHSLRKRGHEKVFRRKTGLVLDPYFSGTKIRWYLDNLKGVRKKASDGKLRFGTIDSWLIWKLTGGKEHVTDFTNASRTLLFNIRNLQWDKELLRKLRIPMAVLPEAKKSGSVFGHTTGKRAGLPEGIPIASVLGDQQAALYGQNCFSAGSIKNTYGTGCFVVLNTGKKVVISRKGLLSTIASDDKGNPVYAMEGSIFVAGAVVQWIRDQLKWIKASKDIEKSVKGLKDTHGVYLVPAFAGLGAPHWDSEARGIICGLTRGADKKHIMRAALESMAYQTADVVSAMKRDYRRKIDTLKVDGGACQNDFLMQFQSDILNLPIERPEIIESTAQGAAYLAGVTVGLWKGKQDLGKIQRRDKVFKPRMKTKERDRLLKGWTDAVKKARA